MAPINNKLQVFKALTAKSTPSGAPEPKSTAAADLLQTIKDRNEYYNPTGPRRFQQRAINMAIEKAGKGLGIGRIY